MQTGRRFAAGWRPARGSAADTRPATGSKDTIAPSHPAGIDKRDTLTASRPSSEDERLAALSSRRAASAAARKRPVSSPDHASCAWEIRATASSQEEAGGRRRNNGRRNIDRHGRAFGAGADGSSACASPLVTQIELAESPDSPRTIDRKNERQTLQHKQRRDEQRCRRRSNLPSLERPRGDSWSIASVSLAVGQCESTTSPRGLRSPFSFFVGACSTRRCSVDDGQQRPPAASVRRPRSPRRATAARCVRPCPPARPRPSPLQALALLL